MSEPASLLEARQLWQQLMLVLLVGPWPHGAEGSDAAAAAMHY